MGRNLLEEHSRQPLTDPIGRVCGECEKLMIFSPLLRGFHLPTHVPGGPDVAAELIQEPQASVGWMRGQLSGEHVRLGAGGVRAAFDLTPRCA